MTHDYVPMTVVAPHVENTPLSEDTGTIPAITENENVPMWMSNKWRIPGQMRGHSIMNNK
jgi:hypothetical protein